MDYYEDQGQYEAEQDAQAQYEAEMNAQAEWEQEQEAIQATRQRCNG